MVISCSGRSGCRQHDDVRDHLEIAGAGELPLERVRAAGRKEGGHGALLGSTHDRGNRRGEQPLRLAHLLTLPGGPVEASAGGGVQEIATHA